MRLHYGGPQTLLDARRPPPEGYPLSEGAGRARGPRDPCNRAPPRRAAPAIGEHQPASAVRPRGRVPPGGGPPAPRGRRGGAGGRGCRGGGCRRHLGGQPGGGGALRRCARRVSRPAALPRAALGRGDAGPASPRTRKCERAVRRAALCVLVGIRCDSRGASARGPRRWGGVSQWRHAPAAVRRRRRRGAGTAAAPAVRPPRRPRERSQRGACEQRRRARA